MIPISLNGERSICTFAEQRDNLEDHLLTRAMLGLGYAYHLNSPSEYNIHRYEIRRMINERYQLRLALQQKENQE
jgi:hypothetical protein